MINLPEPALTDPDALISKDLPVARVMVLAPLSITEVEICKISPVGERGELIVLVPEPTKDKLKNCPVPLLVNEPEVVPPKIKVEVPAEKVP